MSGSRRGRRPPAPPGHVWVDGRILPADGPHLSVFDRGFQLGDGIFETLRVRGARATELAEHIARLRSLRRGPRHRPPLGPRRGPAVGIATCSSRMGSTGPTGDASVRITVSRGAYRGRGLLPPDETVAPTIAIQAWPVTAPPRRPPRARSSAGRLDRSSRPCEPARDAQDHLARRLRLRPPRGASGRRGRCPLPDDRRPPVRGHDGQHLPGQARADDVEELATPSLDCAILPGTTRSWLLVWAARAGFDRSRVGSARPTWPRPTRRSCRRASLGSCR